MIPSPVARPARPEVITARGPNRSTRCGATLDIGITIIAMGSRHRALFRAL